MLRFPLLRRCVIDFTYYLDKHALRIPVFHCIGCDGLEATTSARCAYLYAWCRIWIARRTMKYNGDEAIDPLHIDFQHPFHATRDRLAATVEKWRMLSTTCTLETSRLQCGDLLVLALGVH